MNGSETQHEHESNVGFRSSTQPTDTLNQYNNLFSLEFRIVVWDAIAELILRKWQN
ncbi:hypothetical protein [Nostoc sp. UHCC 0252]|uniref:hypothetical protein n=1 Tax=Nostoc sp. UHCC 0252 TaxID=3110241 RepID=UPI002B1EAAFB|nr:hypothetical protein [Nostoc sp. UHCC 0252]MEA5605797.1 hypothetical protein [Nostoc sp. UHCC 0252]